MKKLALSSIIIQGVYCVACLLNIVICLVYKSAYTTEIGRLCADIALPLTGILSIIPAMPISFIFNLCAKPRKESNTPRCNRLWITWTVLSPILYIVIWVTMVCVFVYATGGV